MGLLLLLGGGCRCADAPPPDLVERDAGVVEAPPTGISMDRVGLRYQLPPGWTVTERETEDVPVDARLYPDQGQRFLVAPRLVVSVERVDGQVDPSRLFDQVLQNVKERVRGAQLLRSSKVEGEHPLGRSAVVQVTYRVRNPELEGEGSRGVQVQHHSWVLVREREERGRFRVTLTLTYLAQDQDLVDVEAAVAGFAPALSSGTEDAEMTHGADLG